MNAYLNAMSKYAVFQGRSSRSEYWLFTLFAVLIGIAASILDAVLGTGRSGTGLFETVVQLGQFLPSLAVGVRRLHDIDRSGWWYLFPLVGIAVILISFATSDGSGGSGIIIGILLFLATCVVPFVFFCTRGTHGPNRFGPEPPETAARGFDQRHSPASQPGTPSAGSSWSPAASPLRRDALAEVERLAKLRAEGSLSEAEFAMLKAQVLATDRPA